MCVYAWAHINMNTYPYMHIHRHKSADKGVTTKNPPKIGELNCVTRTLLYVSFLSLLSCLQWFWWKALIPLPCCCVYICNMVPRSIIGSPTADHQIPWKGPLGNKSLTPEQNKSLTGVLLKAQVPYKPYIDTVCPRLTVCRGKRTWHKQKYIACGFIQNW